MKKTGRKKPEKIRIKSASPRRFARMTRAQALQLIPALLGELPFHPDALYLIGLFQLHPEELTEAGLGYEVIRALEQRASFF